MSFFQALEKKNMLRELWKKIGQASSTKTHGPESLL